MHVPPVVYHWDPAQSDLDKGTLTNDNTVLTQLAGDASHTMTYEVMPQNQVTSHSVKLNLSTAPKSGNKIHVGVCTEQVQTNLRFGEDERCWTLSFVGYNWKDGKSKRAYYPDGTKVENSSPPGTLISVKLDPFEGVVTIYRNERLVSTYQNEDFKTKQIWTVASTFFEGDEIELVPTEGTIAEENAEAVVPVPEVQSPIVPDETTPEEAMEEIDHVTAAPAAAFTSLGGNWDADHCGSRWIITGNLLNKEKYKPQSCFVDTAFTLGSAKTISFKINSSKNDQAKNIMIGACPVDMDVENMKVGQTGDLSFGYDLKKVKFWNQDQTEGDR